MNYENKFVLFLDILGFKKIIENTYDKDVDNEKEIDKLFNALKTIKKAIGLPQGSKKVTQFSDSIVVSFNESSTTKFMLLLDDIGHMLFSLAFNGIICRGALAYGKFYHDENYLFGPALVEAYESESKAAIYPRVIIDKSVIQIFKENRNEKLSPKGFVDSYLDMHLQEDLDDKLFIDYFHSSLYYADSTDIFINYLISLRETISKGLSSARSPDIKVKYGWMKMKFNSALSRVKKDSETDSSYKKLLPKIKSIKYFT